MIFKKNKKGIYFLAKFGILDDLNLFFLLKNLFMMYEDLRRTLIYYFEYKESIHLFEMNNFSKNNDEKSVRI